MSDEARTQGLVDPDALARWMDARKLPGAGAPVTARFVTGGASNELFEIRRGDVRLALRRPPRKVPKGRNETGPHHNLMDWVRRHDEYSDCRPSGGCCG